MQAPDDAGVRGSLLRLYPDMGAVLRHYPVGDASLRPRLLGGLDNIVAFSYCYGDSDEPVQEIQKFMADNAIAPFSARMLRGDLGPAATPHIRDAAGRVVACAHAYLSHNRHSVYKNAA